MLDRQFFGTKVGAAALVSIAAMLSFNVFALFYQLDYLASAPQVVAAPLHPVELA